MTVAGTPMAEMTVVAIEAETHMVATTVVGTLTAETTAATVVIPMAETTAEETLMAVTTAEEIPMGETTVAGTRMAERTGIVIVDGLGPEIVAGLEIVDALVPEIGTETVVGETMTMEKVTMKSLLQICPISLGRTQSLTRMWHHRPLTIRMRHCSVDVPRVSVMLLVLAMASWRPSAETELQMAV